MGDIPVTAAYRQTAAWHRHGTVVPYDQSVTPQEWIDLAGLNWTAQETPITWTSEFGVNVDTDRVIYRSDTGARLNPKKTVSSTYAIHQHLDIWDSLLAVCEIAGEFDMDFVPEAAFPLFGGSWVVYVMGMRGRMIDILGDKYLPYLMAMTSYDESTSSIWKMVGFRPECENMTRMALRGPGAEIKFKHTSQSTARIQAESIRQALGIQIPQILTDFDKMAHMFMEMDWSESRVEQHFEKGVFPVDKSEDRKRQSPNIRRLEEVYSIYNGPLVASATGAWKAHQAIDTWAQHVRGNKSGAARVESNLEDFIGDTLTFTNKSADLLVAAAKASARAI